ncbi:hypothetical protein F4778DRAFT_376886 [Xylariomycetidae sp. FL2044]|nr:hypothetical protein F4778DRAFT_376886 [Xylariomycetidae sp. FL2044]
MSTPTSDRSIERFTPLAAELHGMGPTEKLGNGFYFRERVCFAGNSTVVLRVMGTCIITVTIPGGTYIGHTLGTLMNSVREFFFRYSEENCLSASRTKERRHQAGVLSLIIMINTGVRSAPRARYGIFFLYRPSRTVTEATGSWWELRGRVSHWLAGYTPFLYYYYCS